MAEGLAFAQPWGFLLLMALPGLFLFARKRVAALGRGRGRASLGLRLVLFSLIATALADPRILVPDRRLSVVFALDLSPSVPADQRAAGRAWIAQAMQAANADDQAAIIDFARQPLVEQLGLLPMPSAAGPRPLPVR